MKLLWLCIVANTVGGAVGMDLLEATAKTCMSASDCPALTCHSNSCGNSGKCQYTQLGVGAKCPGQSCSNGGLCDDDANDYCNANAECIGAFKPATTTCRPSAGQCDVAEFCSGTSGLCPIDGYAPSTMTCTGTCNGGACDGQDLCDGYGNCIDIYLPSTTVCHKAVGQCDVAEYCTGSTSACPADTFASATTTCTGTSNGGACDGQDLCDGKGNCVDKYLPSTTVCRASAGQCDVAENCTGTSGQCPADTFAPSTKTCTGTDNGNPCDGQDLCDGKGNCVDVYLPSTTVCRKSAGQCDVAENCTGTSGQCPADTFASATIKCNGSSSGGACDTQDYCDGKGNCVDAYLPSTTVCRPSAGQCDVAENCTGTSGQCPANAFASSTTTCTGTCNGNPCDGQDLCDGKGNCVDNYLPSTTVCRKSAGQCDVAENCTGTSSQCPADTFASSTTKCTGTCSGNPCDGQDLCDGKGNCVDMFLPSTTVCRPAVNVCDVPESCTGTSGQCPTNVFASSTTKCTGTCNGNPCDGQDLCDGKGNCVDEYLPSGIVCSTTQASTCVTPATCTGNMGFCPPDTYAASTTPCTGTSQGGPCDGGDKCDGNGNCVDTFLPKSTVCKKPVGYTKPTYCNGVQGSCPVSSFLEAATNLREMTETVSVSEEFLAVHASSPMMLLGIVCVVAGAVALVAVRNRRRDDTVDDNYKMLLHDDPMSAAF